WILSIVTDPPGVDVFRKPAADRDEAWEHLGKTPIEKVRLARGLFHWKLKKPGYETAEGFGMDRWYLLNRLGEVDFMENINLMRGVTQQGTWEVQLDLQGSRPEGMIRVPRTPPRWLQSRLSTMDIALGPFFLDRYEVTNRQFKQFVDQGGYQKKEFWEHPFVKGGKPRSWEEAMTEFRDATGRPGPATWELGSYLDGHDEYPVAGVSWYEAAAYAKFAGKSLPTVYHWLVASGIWMAGEIIPRSTFGR